MSESDTQLIIKFSYLCTNCGSEMRFVGRASKHMEEFCGVAWILADDAIRPLSPDEMKT